MKQKLLKKIEQYRELIYSLVFFLCGLIVVMNMSFFHLDVFPVKIITKIIWFIDGLFTNTNMQELELIISRSFFNFSIFLYVYLLGFIVTFTPMALSTYFGFKALKRSMSEKGKFSIFFSVLLILAGLFYVSASVYYYIILVIIR